MVSVREGVKLIKKNRTSNVLFSAKESQDRKSWRKFMKIHEIPSMTEILDPYLVSWI
jgi:hypothetical protein